jgi:hypothetical protein
VQLSVGADKRLGGRTLQERSRLAVERRAHKVVARCVVNIELNRGIELDQLHQLGLAKGSRLGGRLRRQCYRSQLGHRMQRLDLERLLLFLRTQ